MMVGEFCKYLNADDFIVITTTDGDFASGFVSNMNDYFDERIIHIGASVYACAYKINRNIGYEIEVA